MPRRIPGRRVPCLFVRTGVASGAKYPRSPDEIVLRKNGKPGALHFRGEARWAGQHAAGKNIALNKVDPKSVLCEQLVGNGDGLHQGATFGF